MLELSAAAEDSEMVGRDSEAESAGAAAVLEGWLPPAGGAGAGACVAWDSDLDLGEVEKI